MQAESPITVACIQMEPKIGEKEANVAHSLDKIAEAAGKGARLIVLPELCNSGYVFASRHEAFTLAEPVPNGPARLAHLDDHSKVEIGLNAVRLRLRSWTWATGQPPSVRVDDEGAMTSAVRPIASPTSGAPRASNGAS